MVDKLAVKSQRAGLNLVRFQFLLVLLLALILSVVFSAKLGYSALAGGVTFVLPNFIFVLMAFAHAGASKSKLVVRGFFAGEAIKLILTVILFTVFLKYGALSLTAFYISFSLLVISQWLAPFFFNYNSRMKHG
ncbi:MAG: ATP synthase protein I [Psychromonas sp.]|jgi:ATP synthase protein I|uniref:ATP synthase subunit I n=1 Tax=Psychromonas sp. TaxID=1884585 RepID=UPI0039E71E6E